MGREPRVHGPNYNHDHDRHRGHGRGHVYGLHYNHNYEPVCNPLKTVGRNNPCPYGSGKKFKKCHGA